MALITRRELPITRIEPTPRMTSEEYEKRKEELLSELPPEFRSEIGYLAYEEGHSSGYEEIINYLIQYVGVLKEPISKLEQRLKNSK